MSYYKEDSVCWWLMSALLTDFPRARKNGSIFMFVEVKLIQTHRYHYIALPLSIPILFINRKSFFFFSISTSLFSSEKYPLFGLFGKWTRDRNKSVEKMKKKPCQNVYLSEFAIEALVDRLKWDIWNREQWASFGLDEIESRQVDSTRSDGAQTE